MGAFSKPYEELFVTQFTVCRQWMEATSQHLGVQLFYRSPQGVTLTKKGSVISPVEHAYRLLIDAQIEMTDRREALSGNSYGASDALGQHILLPRLRNIPGGCSS